LTEQGADVESVIHIIRCQFRRDDFARLGIHPDMQLPPGTACPGTVLLDQPLAGAA
jgi:hypothetical protein